METLLDYIYVFITGGVLCVIAQILIDKTKITPARVLVCYVCAGVILTGVGLYDYIVDFGSMGARIPLTGFGCALAEGVKKAVDRDGLFGVLTGGLTGSAAGITAAILSAMIMTLIFKSKSK